MSKVEYFTIAVGAGSVFMIAFIGQAVGVVFAVVAVLAFAGYLGLWKK